MKNVFTADEVIKLVKDHAEEVGGDNEFYNMACRHIVELFEVMSGKKTPEELEKELEERYG